MLNIDLEQMKKDIEEINGKKTEPEKTRVETGEEIRE